MENKIHDAFENVKADPQITESAKQFLAKKRRKKISFPVRRPLQRVLAAACMLAVLIMGISGYSWLLAPVSYVSIDVNPSMELALNRLDRVVSVTAYNLQAEELLKELRLKGKKYVQAIYMITETEALQKYLTPEEELVITVAADKSRERTLKAGAEQCCEQIGHGSRSISVNLEVASEAHRDGLSVGKYSAYLQLAKYDDSVTVDDCKDMSMAEIHCRIIEHTHGSGHGHGAGQNTEGTSGEHTQDSQEHAQEQDSKEHAQEQSSGEYVQEHSPGEQPTEEQGYPHRRQQRHHGGNHE